MGEQLQIEQIRIKKKYLLLEQIYLEKKKYIITNVSVLEDILNPYKIENFITPQKIVLKYKSLAGVSIPIIETLIFQEYNINFFDSPYWVPFIIKDFKDLIHKSLELQV